MYVQKQTFSTTRDIIIYKKRKYAPPSGEEVDRLANKLDISAAHLQALILLSY